MQSHTQTRRRGFVVKQFRFRAVLANRQVEATVGVIIACCCAALFAINQQTTLLSGHGCKSAMTIAAQEQTASGVVARSFAVRFKKVLREKKVFVAIAIEIAHGNSKCRRELRLDGKRSHFEVIAAIQEHYGVEPVHAQFLCLCDMLAEHLCDRCISESMVRWEPLMQRSQRCSANATITEMLGEHIAQAKELRDMLAEHLCDRC